MNVLSFNREVTVSNPGQSVLNESKQTFTLALIDELFNYRPVAYQLDKCMSVAAENKSVLIGNIEDNSRKMNEKGAHVLDEIGRRFRKQIHSLLSGNTNGQYDDQFSERMVKAGSYFLEKTRNDLLEPLSACSFETDNRSVEKDLNDRLERIRELIGIKLACLETLQNGFEVTAFLNARAIALVRDYSRQPVNPKPEEKTTVEHPLLVKRPRAWRS